MEMESSNPIIITEPQTTQSQPQPTHKLIVPISVPSHSNKIKQNQIEFALGQLKNVERLYFEIDHKDENGIDFSILNESGFPLFKTGHKESTRIYSEFVYREGKDGEETQELKEYPKVCKDFFVKDVNGTIIMSTRPLSIGTVEYVSRYNFPRGDTNNITLLKIGNAKYGELEESSENDCNNMYHLSSTLILENGNITLEPSPACKFCGVNWCQCCITPYQIKQNGQTLGEMKANTKRTILNPGVFTMSFPASMDVYVKAILILAGISMYSDFFEPHCGGTTSRGTNCCKGWVLKVVVICLTLISIIDGIGAFGAYLYFYGWREE